MKSVINAQAPAVSTARIARRPLAALALCAAVALSLQGCIGLVVGGAVMGTLAVVVAGEAEAGGVGDALGEAGGEGGGEALAGDGEAPLVLGPDTQWRGLCLV